MDLGGKTKVGLSNFCMIWESGVRLTFLQMETNGVQELNTTLDDSASYYAEAVTHEVLYEPFLIKVNYSPLTV